MIRNLIVLSLGSALINNVVLSQFLGLCPFLGVSKKVKTALGMGTAVIFVITLASIVDEETANDAEKPMVAGMYINRLNADMPLQADPTIKFALKDFSLKRIYNNMLSVNSPYNTYRNIGLPPGPIRIPTIAGIDAVLDYVHIIPAGLCHNSFGLNHFQQCFGLVHSGTGKHFPLYRHRVPG